MIDMARRKGLNITSLVYEIIRQGHRLGLPYVTRRQIINEAMRTQLAQFAKMKFPKDQRISMLERQIDQALQRLHKAKLIIRKGRGRWTIKRNKVKPVLCVHLRKLDESTYYCPVRKVKIPYKTALTLCRDIIGRKYNRKTKSYEKYIHSHCPGYMTTKSTPLTIEYSKQLIRLHEGKKRKKKYVGGY